MATPRPPGVRRAGVFEERLAHAANSPTHAPRFVSLWLVGLRFARIRSLRSATLPSPANPHIAWSRARFIGSGNVVGGRSVTRNPPKKDRGRAPSMARSAKNELILKKDECIECY